MKYFLILFVFVTSCETCRPSEEMSRELLVAFVGEGECNFEKAKKDIDELIDDIDYCDSYRERFHVQYAPSGVPCSSACIACSSVVQKIVAPTMIDIKTKWDCKKPVSQSLLDLTCSNM